MDEFTEKFNLLIIDPQNDFIDTRIELDNKDAGRLAVSGANDDMKRISTMIMKHKDQINKIFVSLDTHTSNHIGHYFFRELNSDGTLGVLAPPFTTYSVAKKNELSSQYNEETIIKGSDGKTYVVNVENENEREIMNIYAKIYIQKLNQGKKYAAITWPIHCIPRTGGWGISPTLLNVLNDNTINSKVEYHIKGQNQLAEMYSIMQAEVSYESCIKHFGSPIDSAVINKYVFSTENDNSSDDPSRIKFIKPNANIDKLDKYVPSNNIPSIEDIKTSFNLQTTFNESLFKKLTENNSNIVVCGEALSHCVKYSTLDIDDNIKKKGLKNKVFVVKNGSSSVGGFETSGSEFLTTMKDKLLEVNDDGKLVSVGLSGGKKSRQQKKGGKRTSKRNNGGKRTRKQRKSNKRRSRKH